MRTSHVTHSANILTHFLLTQYFCLCVNFTFLCGDLNKYLTKYRQSQEIFYNVCSEAKCVIINLKLFVNKICKNASNLTHYLTTKNFCNLLKFETKTRFSNCQKVVRIFHPILLWQITSRPGYLFSKSNFSTRSYFCFPARAGRCFVSPRHSRCSWRTWWAASTPSTPSARGWRWCPWSATWSRWESWGASEPSSRGSTDVSSSQTRTLIFSTRIAPPQGRPRPSLSRTLEII